MNTPFSKNENEALTKESPRQVDPSGSTLNLFHKFSEKTALLSENRYTLLKELGEGGMGVVQLVRDEILGREVALKKIHLTKRHIQKKEKQLLWRLQREAEIMAILEHPNIVPLYEIQIAKEQELQFTMKKVEGKTLRQLLEAHNDPHSPKERYFLEILLKVCDGIRYAHAKGVIHRDLKPNNIMVGNYGEVYILDWGIAKKLGEILPTPSLQTLQTAPEYQTIGGIGTLGYMAPEQQKSASEVNAQADIYSLGKILRECYTKLSPWQELKSYQKYLQEIQHKKNHAPHSFQEELEIHIPREIQSIIKKATEKQPTERYPSVEAFAHDLTNYLKDIPVSAQEYRLDELLRKWSKRHRKSLTVWSLFFLMLFSLWGFSQWKNHQNYRLAVTESNKTQTLAEHFIGSHGRESRDKFMRLLLQSLVSLNKAFIYKSGKYEEEASKVQIVEKILPLCYEEEDYQLASFIIDDLQTLTHFPRTKQILSIQCEEQKSALSKQHLSELTQWKKKYMSIAQESIKEGERDDFIFQVSKMREEEVLQQLLLWVEEGTSIFIQEQNISLRQKSFYVDIAKVIGKIGNPQANEKLRSCFLSLYQYLKILNIPITSKGLQHLREGTILTTLEEKLNAVSKKAEKWYLKKIEGNQWEIINESKETLFEISFIEESQSLEIYSIIIKNEDYLYFMKEILISLFYLEDQLSIDIILDIKHNGKLAPFFFSHNEYLFKKLLKNSNFRLPQTSMEYLKKGTLEEYQGNLNQAIADYTESIRLAPTAMAYNNRGNVKMNQGDIDGAIADFDQGIRLNPKASILYNNRGSAKENKNDFQSAILDFMEAIRLNPKYTMAHNNCGVLKDKMGLFDEAISHFTEVLHLDPQNVDAYINRGLSKQQKKDFDESIADFTDAIRLNPKSIDSYLNRGISKFKKNLFEEAIADFTKIIYFDPQFVQAYAIRGEAKHKLHNYQGALLDFNEAIALNPQYFEAYYYRACLKITQEYFTEAISDFNRCIQLNPKSMQAYMHRGETKAKQGDFIGALNDLDEAIRLDPQFAELYNDRGLVKFAQEDFEGAILDLNEAIRLNPSFILAYNNLGIVKERIENFAGAISDYTKAIQFDPEFFDSYYNRGLIKQKINDFDGAIADFTKTISLAPQHAKAYVARGSSKQKINDLDGSISDCNEAIYLNPQFSAAYSIRGSSKLSKQEFDGAFKDFEEAIRLNPQDKDAYTNRGHIKMRKQDITGAILDFTKALSIDPQYPFAYFNLGFAKMTQNDKAGAIEAWETGLSLQPHPELQGRLINLLKDVSREQFTKKDWKNAKETLLKLKKYLTPEDPQHKQIDQKIQQIETLLIPEKK